MEIDTEIDLMLSRKYEQKIMNAVPFSSFLPESDNEGFFAVLYHNPAGILFMTVCLLAYLAAVLLSDRIWRLNYEQQS